MRQIVYRRFGEPADVLEVEDVPAPRAGEGQVVIALEAAPIHLADLKHIRGLPWFDGYRPPHVAGYEGVGRIVEIGAAVDAWREGDRVFLPIRFGTWRERIVADAQGLWRAPEEPDAAQLALVPINVLTAWLMLDSVVPMKPGDWFIQNAANSNVGYYLRRIAERLGLRSINVVRRAELLPLLAEQGGHLNLEDGDDLAARVREGCEPGRLRLAIDAIAGEATTRLGACFGTGGGHVVSYGMLSGEPCRIPPEMLMLDEVVLSGFYMSRTLARLSAEDWQRARDGIDAFIADEPLAAPIANIYPFDRIAEAVHHAARFGSDREGKIVLVP